MNVTQKSERSSARQSTGQRRGNPKSRLQKLQSGSYRTSEKAPDFQEWWIRAVSRLSLLFLANLALRSPFPCRLIPKSRDLPAHERGRAKIFLPSDSAPATGPDSPVLVENRRFGFRPVLMQVSTLGAKRRRSKPLFGEPNRRLSPTVFLLVPYNEECSMRRHSASAPSRRHAPPTGGTDWP